MALAKASTKSWKNKTKMKKLKKLLYWPLFTLGAPLYVMWDSQYSGDPETDPSKTGNIWKPDILEVRFQMVQFLNSQDYSYRAMVPTIWKPD